MITAVCASRGSKDFLIFLPAVDPCIYSGGSIFCQVSLNVSKIQTSDKGCFYDSLLSTSDCIELICCSPFISVSESISIVIYISLEVKGAGLVLGDRGFCSGRGGDRYIS